MYVCIYIYKIHMYINKDDVRNDKEDNRKDGSERDKKKWCEEKNMRQMERREYN